jgi:hypothetical protein
VSDSLPDRNMFDIFSQGLFEGVKPMMVIRDHRPLHPSSHLRSDLSDRGLAFHPSLQVRPVPLSGKLPPLSGCLPLAGDLRGVQKGGEDAGAAKEVEVWREEFEASAPPERLRRWGGAEAFGNSLADSVSFRFPSPPHRLSSFAPSAKSPRNSSHQTQWGDGRKGRN